MVKVSDILTFINSIAPFDWAEPWDNVGLMAGNKSNQVFKAAVALDCTPATLKETANMHCNLLLTHHPMLFSPIKTFDTSTFEGKCVQIAMQEDINVIACHTNWDKARDGVNWTLAEALNLNNIAPLIEPTDGSFGLGAFGNLEVPMQIEDFQEFVNEAWALSWSRMLPFGDNKKITKVAIGGGSCGDMWEQAHNLGADVFITSDTKHHQHLYCENVKMPLFICDHGEMESLCLQNLVQKLRDRFDVEIHLLKKD